MMEESSEEQPEMVSHEEAVQAEKEATQMSTGSPAAAGLAAPSPLPAFISTPSTPLSSKSAEVSSTPKSSTSSGSAIATPVPSQKAPGTLEIPHANEQFSELSIEPVPIAAPGDNGGSLFGWISGNSFMNKVVEKTKTSLDLVITTLDPGMKDVIYSGEALEVVVTSSKENKIIPIREAFQKVFVKASVSGMDSQANTAAQPVGFTAGVKGAEERISNLRKSGSLVEGQVVVSIEGFIAEILPERWFEMSCLMLKDVAHGIELQTFSQPTAIPVEHVMTAQDKTPSNYPLRWSGLAMTIGEVIEKAHPHIGHADWQMFLSGVSRRQSLSLAAQSLAHMYKEKLPSAFVS